VAGSFLLPPLTTKCAGTPPKKEQFNFAKDSLTIEAADDKCQSSVGPYAYIPRAECAGARKFAWGEELDKVYKHGQEIAIKYEDTLVSQTLRRVQGKRPEWRDANMDLCLDWFAYEKGPEGRITAVSCQGNVNRDRAIWILKLISPNIQ
jgi:hypothetical protein